MKPIPSNLAELQKPGWKSWARIFVTAILAEQADKKQEQKKQDKEEPKIGSGVT